MLITDGLRFSGIAARLGAVAASLMPGSPNRSTGLYGRHTYMRPTGKALRNPADPHQKARIGAAAYKRERKEWIRDRNALKSFRGNAAHYLASDHRRLDPFFIAR